MWKKSVEEKLGRLLSNPDADLVWHLPYEGGDLRVYLDDGLIRVVRVAEVDGTTNVVTEALLGFDAVRSGLRKDTDLPHPGAADMQFFRAGFGDKVGQASLVFSLPRRQGVFPFGGRIRHQTHYRGSQRQAGDNVSILAEINN